VIVVPYFSDFVFLKITNISSKTEFRHSFIHVVFQAVYVIYYDDSLGSSSLFDRVVCELVFPFLVVIFLDYMRVSLENGMT